MSKYKFRPCPFCGQHLRDDNAHTEQADPAWGNGMYCGKVVCPQCHGMIVSQYPEPSREKAKKQAAAYWNCRVDKNEEVKP